MRIATPEFVMNDASPVLRQPIAGGWTQRTVVAGGRRFLLVVPADPDEYLSRLEEQPDQKGPLDPYWAELWPAASLMAEAILRARWQVGTPMLEIGCGVGLVGLAALASGLAVTFSDYVPIAVEAAVANARRNGFRDARAMLLDWRNPPAVKYPLIVASDVLYDSSQHAPLLDCVDRMLGDDGLCWIGDPGRFQASGFLNLAAQRFQIQLRDASGTEIRDPVSGQFQLIKLTRKGRLQIVKPGSDV